MSGERNRVSIPAGMIKVSRMRLELGECVGECLGRGEDWGEG